MNNRYLTITNGDNETEFITENGDNVYYFLNARGRVALAGWSVKLWTGCPSEHYYRSRAAIASINAASWILWYEFFFMPPALNKEWTVVTNKQREVVLETEEFAEVVELIQGMQDSFGHTVYEWEAMPHKKRLISSMDALQWLNLTREGWI